MTSADALSRIPRGFNQDTRNDHFVKGDNDPVEDSEIFAVQGAEQLVGEGRVRIEFVQEPHIAAVKWTNNMPTLEDIWSQLPEREEFVNIYNYLKSKILPRDDEVARATVIEAQDFVLQDDLLYLLYSPRRKKLERAFSVIRNSASQKNFKKIERSNYMTIIVI